MHRLMEYFARHAWLTLAVLLLISGLASTQLGDVKIEVTAEELMLRDDPDRDYYEQVLRKFGDEQAILIYLRDVELLNPQKLELLEHVINTIEKEPFVDRVESLFSIPRLRTVDGFLSKEPYLAEIPQNLTEGEAILAEAQANPFLKQVLISGDREIMAIAVIMSDGEVSVDDYQVTQVINGHIEPLSRVYDEAFAIGFPFIRTEIAENIRLEQTELIPLAVIALLVTLFLMLRQFVDILMPVMTASLSILWMLGIMPLIGIPLNVVTSIVPILLIIVGSTEDIHLLSEFRQAQKQRACDVDTALRMMARKMGRTVLLTFITTAIGFLSVSLSKIEMLWQFGVLSALGLMFNFVVTIALIPAVLKITGNLQLDGGCKHFSPAALSRAGRYWDFLSRQRLPILLVLAAIMVGFTLGIPSIQVNHNAVDSLGKHSMVRAQVEKVNDNLAGLETLSVVLDSGIEDTFLKVKYLHELIKIQEFLAEQGKARSTTSFNDYLSVLNSALLEIEEPESPLSDAEVNELMIFLDHKHVNAYVSGDYSSARVLVRHAVSSTSELQAFISELENFLAANVDPGLRYRVTGDSVLTVSAVQAMIQGQLQSILLLLVIIVLVISVLFLDLKVGVLAAFTNLLPVIVLFGVMGYFAIPLNIGTTMAAAIAIGIAVDDTMHFMLRYNRELRESKQQNKAMVTTIHGEMLPIISTSAALVLGFMVFAFSDFEPVAQFGMLSALVIATALFTDLVLTPIAISSLRLVTIWDLLSFQLREEIIGKSALFKGLRKWEIRKFVLASNLVSFDAGRQVFVQGDPSEEMYMVMTGSVEVNVTDASGEKVFTELILPGETFGEVAMLAAEPRKTNALALENCSLLVLTRESIENTTRLNQLVSAKVFKNMAKDISRRHVRYLGIHSRINREDD